MFQPSNTKVGGRGCVEASFFLPLHQHAFDAVVGNEPQEGGEHIPAAHNPWTHERERNGEGNLPLLVFASGETAMSSRLLFIAGGLFGGDGLFFLLVGAAGLGLFL
jgi:hypothetical protein